MPRSWTSVAVVMASPVIWERRPWKEIRPVGPQSEGPGILLISGDGETYAYQNFGALSDLYLIDGLK